MCKAAAYEPMRLAALMSSSKICYPFIKEYQAVNLSDFAQSFYIKQPPSIFHEPHEHHSSGKETKAADE